MKKMGQIVKRKKKGRPSKADLARRTGLPESSSASARERDLRRSIRRRNVRYTFDYDDYIDEEDYEEDEEDENHEMRREKKLELVLKKSQVKARSSNTELAPSLTRRVTHAPSVSSSSSSDYGDDSKPLKKRKIDGDDEDADENDEDDEEDEDEVQPRKSQHKRAYSVPGIQSNNAPSGVPLPDKQTLELILDKLQKKDIYGVFAEPVDPEELPDYHDVIKHPMDFGTVRRKLGNGKYRTLEQFESDVFLICTNAMKYNAPDTIYHKQAYSIQELAKIKFERIKSEIEYSNKEIKSEPMPRSNSLPTKQIKKTMNCTGQHEPVSSDFPSAPTIPTAADIHNTPRAPQAVESEKPVSVDGFAEPNAVSADISLDKGEELPPGKGLLAKLGRRPSVQEENRRATYQISTEPKAIPESIFTTFEDEIKQLVPVGLNADHSYARSLARFAATLGSAAWQVAAKRIEQALPPESKFGRGWVVEFEPISTPVLTFENQTLKEPAFFTKSQLTNDVKKDAKVVSTSEHPLSRNHIEGKPSLFGQIGSRTTATGTNCILPAKEEPFRVGIMEGKPSLLCSPRSRPTDSASVSYQQQNLPTRGFVETEKKVVNAVELNGTPSPNQNRADFAAPRQISNRPEVPDSRNRNLSNSVSFKQPNYEGVATASPKEKAPTNNSDRNRMVPSSTDSFINPMVRAANYFPHGQEYGVSDPVQMMRSLTEKTQNQQKPSKHSTVEIQPVVLPVPSTREDTGNAATAAARAWMSIGAAGFRPENMNTNKNQTPVELLNNRNQDRQPQVSRFRGEFPVAHMQYHPNMNGFPLHAFVPPHTRMGNEPQLQNQHMVFPQFVTTDLSRVQGGLGQSFWRGTQMQQKQKQKQESLPPDLNIGFPQTGSPVRQSSGVMVDSQQPDLALQL